MKIIDTDGIEITTESLKKSYGHNFLDDWFPDGLADYRASYTLTHPWKIIDYIFRQIKWAWQRVFRGWDDRVVWSIDHYLAEMIPVWVNRLQEDSVGIPICFFDDEEWDSIKNEYPEGADEKAKAKYHLALNQIINGFDSYIKMQDVKYNSFEYKELEAIYKIGFEQFRKYFSDLWD